MHQNIKAHESRKQIFSKHASRENPFQHQPKPATEPPPWSNLLNASENLQQELTLPSNGAPVSNQLRRRLAVDNTPSQQMEMSMLQQVVPRQENYNQSRSTALHNVESTITELSGIFSHLATMVAHQGELAIRIDDNMDESLANVEGAHNSLLRNLNRISSNRLSASPLEFQCRTRDHKPVLGSLCSDLNKVDSEDGKREKMEVYPQKVKEACTYNCFLREEIEKEAFEGLVIVSSALKTATFCQFHVQNLHLRGLSLYYNNLGTMLPQKQGEETMMSSLNETIEREEREEEKVGGSHSSLRSLLWHGGSVYDAWFSCASNQVAQVLLTLPCSFAQLGMLSGIIFQVFYGLMGSWTAYLISILYIEYRSRKEKENVNFKNHVIQWFEVLEGLLGPYWKAVGLAFNCTFLLFGSVIQLIACASNIYYINDHLDKRTWTYIFGACCATTVFIPSFHNYRIWSFLGLGMTTYTAWYLTIAAIVHGQVENVTHTGPKKLVLYFTGATNILYTFGGHAVTVEIMHAMWKPQKFKYIYLYATLFVFTLTLPSAIAVYWAFGDQLLDHSNAFSLLPRTGWRDAGVILMLIHQFITFGFACTPLYFVWEKVIGMHDTKSICLRALARLPVVIPIWFLAIIFPFFGPINSAVGALLVTFTVYVIPASAHMLTYRSASARQNAAEKLPLFIPNWTIMYVINAFVMVWVLVVGFGFGGWASMANFIKQVDKFGLFAKCYQCPPHKTAGSNQTLHH
ncbi:unnamed protein product [Sphenostylis stenocarpa]|uniref:t-SNARE coiled-coil homology domain-containing protein n=1 Tax=Sphenostylis stenocarpa TaxID=92480 RepID=A0AA86T3P6_9FABA|nr:unnamed protein product [Sphenostylis stenocarpa]